MTTANMTRICDVVSKFVHIVVWGSKKKEDVSNIFEITVSKIVKRVRLGVQVVVQRPKKTITGHVIRIVDELLVQSKTS